MEVELSFRSVYSRNKVDVESGSMLGDPTFEGLNALTSKDCNNIPIIRIGSVLRSCPVTHDYDVAVNRSVIWKCTKLSIISHPGTGVLESSELLEGSKVLVVSTDKGSNRGFILGSIPTPLIESGEEPIPAIPRTSLESGTALDDTWIETYLASDRTYKQLAHSGRPIDTLPGEHHLVDPQYGSRLSVSGPNVEMVGSPVAKVRVSALDDIVDIHADTLREVTATGDRNTYDDGGMTSYEEEVSLYKHERLGESEGEKPFIERTANYLKGFLSKLGKKLLTGKSISRLKIYKGYLGGVFHAIVSIPGKGSGDRESPAQDGDKGVFSFHVGEQGLATLRSAAGISIVLTKKIPVPTRKRLPWDPNGSIGSDIDLKAGFSGSYGYLDDRTSFNQKRSAEMYGLAQAYEPFSKLQDDFTLPGPREVPSVSGDEKTDETAGRSFPYSEKEDVFATITIDEEGGIVAGGGEGCELRMRNGIITMSAPRGIFMTSGEDIVQLSGGSSIVKAHDNVEVVASEGDVRIKAENNLHMVAASDTRGSVVIESKSTSPARASGEGEEVVASGIIIKCDDGETVMRGNRVTMDGDTSTIVGDQIITFHGGSIIGKGEAVTFTDGKALLNIRNSAQLGGSSVIIEGTSNLALIKNGTSPEVEWSESESVGLDEHSSEIAESLDEYAEELKERLDEEFEVTYIDSYSESIVEDVESPEWFVNREAYGYEAGDKWEDTKLGETSPWPGTDAEFRKIDGLKNRDAGDWKEVKDTDGEETMEDFENYPRIL